MSDGPSRRILLGVTGGVAAYKVPTLVSRWVQAGAEVRVLLTEAGQQFVTPTTLSSLSGQRVVTSMWDQTEHAESPHVAFARWAEVMVLAPASADSLGRLAHGLCDDVVTLTATALPNGTPLLVAPAMNADMWAKPTVRRNLETLRELWPNFHEVGPDEGWQACRTSGAGRMAEPDAIAEAVENLLS